MNRWIIATVSLILSLVLTGCVTGDVRCHRLPDGHWGCEGGVGGSPPPPLSIRGVLGGRSAGASGRSTPHGGSTF